MRSTTNTFLVLVTAPNLRTARKLAKALLQNRLVACVNILPNIESHYWWHEKIESSPELLLLIKTTRAKLDDLEKCVAANHPYDTPECIALPLKAGSARYLSWLTNSLRT